MVVLGSMEAQPLTHSTWDPLTVWCVCTKKRLLFARRSLAGMTGFEPAISALTGQRVKPLHYTPE